MLFLNKLKTISPRVIVVEYNAKFPPPIRKSIKYDPKFIWKYDDYFGTSLQLLEDNLKNFGYVLAGCNILGVNAFFIKKKLSGISIGHIPLKPPDRDLQEVFEDLLVSTDIRDIFRNGMVLFWCVG